MEERTRLLHPAARTGRTRTSFRWPAGLPAVRRGPLRVRGSALGSGGVAARLNRHLKDEKRTHWHIDYFAAAARITGAAAAYGADRRECAWAQRLAALEGAKTPAAGFGSTDCRAGCRAHLLRLPDALPLSWIEDELIRCPIQAI